MANLHTLLWHAFHNELFIFYTGTIEQRIAEIKENKPRMEWPLRLRLLKEVDINRLPPRLVSACKVCDKAWKAYVKAGKALEAHDKAREAYNKAWEAHIEAREACRDEIEALHKEVCPNCPWDGETIFTRKDEKGIWY